MRAPAITMQPSLLGVEASDHVERVQLDGCCWFDIGRGWQPEPDALFAELLDGLEWSHTERWMYDRMVIDPRLGATVRSGWPAVDAARTRLEDRYGGCFGAVWCNLYRDGTDSVAWHGDRIGRDRPVQQVAIVSLGGPRTFRVRPAGGGRGHSILLHSGDLVVMGGRMQTHFEHAVPKRARAEARISVTFRERRAGNADRRAGRVRSRRTRPDPTVSR